MRRRTTRIFLLAVLIISASSCSREENGPLTELEKLPPPTQEGADTFGCLVNGKALVTLPSVGASAAYLGGFLKIGAKVNSTTSQIQNIQITAKGPLILNAPYDFKSTNECSVKFSTFLCEYGIANVVSGTLTIAQFDDQSLIVSGVFEFITLTSGCETLVVTDGRFDLKLTP